MIYCFTACYCKSECRKSNLPFDFVLSFFFNSGQLIKVSSNTDRWFNWNGWSFLRYLCILVFSFICNKTVCDTQFVCEEGGADYIARLDEPETCSYVMTIHTMKICHHPFLKPPTPTQTVTITCNPLLTDTEYQEFKENMLGWFLQWLQGLVVTFVMI